MKVHGNTTHGMGHSTENRTWSMMRNRCLNPKSDQYLLYGGRGITICKRWDKFENFIKDMGFKPSSKHSLDRINTNGNYSKKNCRWATQKEQCRNKRTNKMVTYKGKTLCLMDWAEKTGVPYKVLWNRLYTYKIPMKIALNPKSLI